MQISVSFTDQQKLSTQAYIDNIHISFLKENPETLVRQLQQKFKIISFKWR